MNLTLRSQVNGAIIITFALITMAVVFIVLPLQKHRFETGLEDIEILLKTLVQRDTEALANEIFDNRLTAITIRIGKMKTVKGILGITIFDHRGSLLAARGQTRLAEDIRPDVQAQLRQEPRVSRISHQGVGILIYSQEIKFLGEELGFIRIIYSLEELERNRRLEYVVIGGILAAVLFVMLIVLNWLLSRFILDPITHLKDAARLIARGDLDHEIGMDRRDELGNLADSFETMRDAIGEKISALEHAGNLIEATIDAMPSILVGVDKRGRITQWNRAAYRETGQTAEQSRGLPIERVFPFLENQRVMAAIEERSAQPPTRVARQIAHGQTRYEDVTIYPLDKKGGEGAVIRIDDVTDRVHFEEMMIQTEKMMSLGGLAAGMAHEINNPLAGILQNASLLASRLNIKNAMPATKKAMLEAGITMEGLQRFMEARQVPRHLDAITDSVKRIASLVENMLSFARKGDTTFSMHSPEALLDRAITLAATDFDLKRNCDFKSVEIIKEYEPGLPDIPCEPSKIQQVLLNILSNGVYAMAGIPSPRFILRLAVEQDTRMLKMEIQDNGPGMDEFAQKRIFEPFYTTKRVGDGTGLGMSVSYFIITEHHSGTLAVISDPGYGTTFIIRLPLTRPS